VSGILNSKSRVLDTIITSEGRRQLADGGLRIRYVSFSDAATFYKPDLVSGSQDATTRLYFESCNLPQDQITFQANDSGRLQPFNNSNGVQVTDGQLIDYSFAPTSTLVFTGSSDTMYMLSGSAFASSAGDLLRSSIDNFQKLYLIASHDRLFEDDGFSAGGSSIEYQITRNGPIYDSSLYSANVNHLDSLFNDPRFSTLKNFKFLPPLQKGGNQLRASETSAPPRPIGNYVPWGYADSQDLKSKLFSELKSYAQAGFSRTISFDPTSRSNKLVAQMFEISNNTMKKLDVVAFDTSTFFVGKVLLDENGSQTFVHIFTLIFGS
jgi:hypothetical protein